MNTTFNETGVFSTFYQIFRKTTIEFHRFVPFNHTDDQPFFKVIKEFLDKNNLWRKEN